MCYLNLIFILLTVNFTSAGRLPHKANFDAVVYTRQDLLNMSNVYSKKLMLHIEYYHFEQ